MIAAFRYWRALAAVVLFSKIAELVVANILNSDVGFAFEISGAALGNDRKCWLRQFFIDSSQCAASDSPFCKTNRTDADSEAVGEKAPKLDSGLFGVLLFGRRLLAGYIHSKSGGCHAVVFLVAVIMVIPGNLPAFHCRFGRFLPDSSEEKKAIIIKPIILFPYLPWFTG